MMLEEGTFRSWTTFLAWCFGQGGFLSYPDFNVRGGGNGGGTIVIDERGNHESDVCVCVYVTFHLRSESSFLTATLKPWNSETQESNPHERTAQVN